MLRKNPKSPNKISILCMCAHKCHAHPPLLYLICQQPIKDLKNWQIFSCSFMSTSSHSDTFSPQTVWLSNNICLIFARAKCRSFCADKRRLWEPRVTCSCRPGPDTSGYLDTASLWICSKTLSLACPGPSLDPSSGDPGRESNKNWPWEQSIMIHEEILNFQCLQFCL